MVVCGGGGGGVKKLGWLGHPRWGKLGACLLLQAWQGVGAPA
jgi:hypothetical protein